MTSTLTTNDVLNDYGWNLFDKCTCGGPLRQEFRNTFFPDMNLFFWPSLRVFTIKRDRGSKTKVPPTSTSKLKIELNAL